MLQLIGEFALGILHVGEDDCLLDEAKFLEWLFVD
jgi:hypothetical protein